MIIKHLAKDRGITNMGWLESRHSFSFGRFYNPERMGFHALRVINDDRVKGGYGFSEHGHDNMEIFSYIVSGALRHRDSQGHESTIGPGGVQVMSAGDGIRHSEMNASSTEDVHFLQVWIDPKEQDTTPHYAEKTFTDLDDRLRLILSNDGRDESLTLGQDVAVYAGKLRAGVRVSKALTPYRHAWLQVISGHVHVNDTVLHTGDGAQITDEETLTIAAQEASELILIYLHERT